MDDEEQVILAMRALREHGIVHEVEEVVIAGDGCEAERAPKDEGEYGQELPAAA